MKPSTSPPPSPLHSTITSMSGRAVGGEGEDYTALVPRVDEGRVLRRRLPGAIGMGSSGALLENAGSCPRPFP